MFTLLALLTKSAQTYTRSLQKDLVGQGYNSILVISSISWVGVLILLALVLLGKFQLPTSPTFYVYWFILVFIVTIQFYFYSKGLANSQFYSANSISHISFVITIFYAVLFLKESISPAGIVAIVIAVIGSLLLFKWQGRAKNAFKQNMGLIFIIFALLISPASTVLLKSAVLQTNSFSQYLTGRLVLDLIYYSAFLCVLYVFWYRRKPGKSIKEFFKSKQGLIFMFGTAVANLVDSLLIYRLPVVTLTILGTVGIVAGYVIGRVKYKEPIYFREALGGALIVLSIIIFALQ